MSFNELDKESYVDSVYYKFASDLASLNAVEEKEYKINLWEQYADAQGIIRNSQRIYLTPTLSLPDIEGIYYISIRLKDKSGNISDRYILSYYYLKEHYKSLNNIKFYSDSNYKNIVGNYDYDLVNSENNFKVCITKYKNIFVDWQYNQDYSSYIARKFPSDMWNLTASDKVNNKDLQLIDDSKFAVLDLEMGEEYNGDNCENPGVIVGSPRTYCTCENESDKLCKINGNRSSFLLKPFLGEDNLFLESKNTVIQFIYNPQFDQDFLCGDVDEDRWHHKVANYYVLKGGNSLTSNNNPCSSQYL